MTTLFVGMATTHAQASAPDVAETAPVELTDEKRPTARVRAVTFDTKRKRYVVRATIASAALRGNSATRAKTSLKASVSYASGGKRRTDTTSVKLSAITVVSRDPDKGLATVEILVPGQPADKKGDLRTSVALVGGNPTPHP